MTKKTHAKYIAVIVTLGATIVWMANNAYLRAPESSEETGKTASIAVLPFYAHGGDSSSEVYAATATTMLIDALSGSPHFRVIPEATAIAATESHLSIREIGRELSVSYVLEGGVEIQSEDLRIAIQLINARNEEHVWAEVHELDIDDLPIFVASIKSELLGLTR